MQLKIRVKKKKIANFLKHWLRLVMWTSGGAILRDLSRAQGAGGRGGHSELRALRSRDRPPPPSASRSISEETEEYVRGLLPVDGGADAGACEGAPDLRHIQQMLDMMRKLNIVDANDEALISELDSYAIERPRSSNLCRAELARPAAALGGPAAALGGPARIPPAAASAPAAERALPPHPNKHKKRRRNIALESIIESLENNHRIDAINCTSEQLTLLKPEDLITKFQENINKSTCGPDHEHDEGIASYDRIDSNDKVSHWMKQMMSPIRTNSQSKRVVGEAMRRDPGSMFKKKVKGEDAKPCTKLNSAKCLGNGSTSYEYVPSGDASRCYQRYLENNKQIQIRQEVDSQLAALIMEALERAAQAEGTERAIQVEPTERAIQVEATERAIEVEGRERAMQVEGTKREMQVEGTKREMQVEGTQREMQVEGTKREMQVEGTKREMQVEGTKREMQVEGMKREMQVEGTKREMQVEGTKREMQVESTKREMQVEGTKREMQVEGREVAAVEEYPECGAVVSAPGGGARLAAPRRCLPREPCLVCRLREDCAARAARHQQVLLPLPAAGLF